MSIGEEDLPGNLAGGDPPSPSPSWRSALYFRYHFPALAPGDTAGGSSLVFPRGPQASRAFLCLSCHLVRGSQAQLRAPRGW